MNVVVCGLGVSGTAAVRVLRARGDTVHCLDEALGLRPPDGEVPDLVVVSPGWRPDHPALAAWLAAGVPVWGEVELAWRLGSRDTGWLVVTGTNGKTTTTEMLAAILAAAGVRSLAAGNIGPPLVDAVTGNPPPELLAVELSSFQLHWSASIRPKAAALLNVAPDHLDWHGTFEAYAAAKAKVFAPGTVAVVNRDDPVASSLAPAGAAGFTLRAPGEGELGVAGGQLRDDAFGHGDLLPVSALRVAGPHNVANALAAAALAFAAGLDAEPVRTALAGFTTGAHRLAVVGEVAGVRYVDDSKATNPHAAARAIASFDSVVWLAGGLNKGLAFDELVAAAAPRLRAVVLIGTCADELRDALGRHAPHVPVHAADGMHTAVTAARGLARAGDVVLLAPAAASMDMFRDYAERGDAFAAEVREL